MEFIFTVYCLIHASVPKNVGGELGLAHGNDQPFLNLHPSIHTCITSSYTSLGCSLKREAQTYL